MGRMGTWIATCTIRSTITARTAGKRHRPLICFAACLAVGGDPDRAATAAAAIEHFHSAALIHDDIADEAELRRGEPCLHLTEGLGLAINMGDLALSMVNGPVVNDPLLDDAAKVRVINELIAMTCRTVEGQALDHRAGPATAATTSRPRTTSTMAIHKTAHYSGAVPLAVGAIVGGADDEIVEALRSYGLDTGLAFQIQDDLLNLVGTDEAKKKDFRSDITEGKRTLVVVHALQNAAPEARERLVEILSSKERDPEVLAEAVAIMEETGSIDYARTYAEDLTLNAKARLAGALPPSPYARLARIHGRLVREQVEVTWNLSRETTPAPPSRTCSTRLARIGHLPEDAITGIFDDATAAALAEFLRRLGAPAERRGDREGVGGLGGRHLQPGRPHAVSAHALLPRARRA